jgi:hypothetical protein
METQVEGQVKVESVGEAMMQNINRRVGESVVETGVAGVVAVVRCCR